MICSCAYAPVPEYFFIPSFQRILIVAYNTAVQITCINSPLKNVSFAILLVNIVIGKNVQYIKGNTPNTFSMDFGNKSMGKTLPDKKSSKISLRKKKEVTSVSQNTSKLIIIFMKKFSSKENSSIIGKSNNWSKFILRLIFEACIMNMGIKVMTTIKS